MFEQRFRAGEYLIRDGEAGESAFIVAEGVLRLEKDGVHLLSRGPGTCVGEFALIDEAPRSLDCVAETEMLLHAWKRGEFQAELREDPEIASGLFRILLDKLREDMDSQAERAKELQEANLLLERENRKLRISVSPTPDPVFESDNMARLFDDVGRIAPTPSTFLIRGETGVGKEVIAGRIHEQSAHADGPFVALHSAALQSG
tara:strand:+ start:1732 stop:2340 length:609 start_codon:yes stop_codon:yes gene_type:complete